MRRRDIARSVADGRQQLDRRESDAIIVGQVAFAMIIGEEGMTGGDGEGRGRGGGGVYGIPAYALARGQHHIH